MKFTGSGESKHRQLQLPFEGFLLKVPAEQGEDARACVPPGMNETDITDTKPSRLSVNFGTAVYRTVRTVVLSRSQDNTTYSDFFIIPTSKLSVWTVPVIAARTP